MPETKDMEEIRASALDFLKNYVPEVFDGLPRGIQTPAMKDLRDNNPDAYEQLRRKHAEQYQLTVKHKSPGKPFFLQIWKHGFATPNYTCSGLCMTSSLSISPAGTSNCAIKTRIV